jgi:CheY-like chemotaxis protein
MVQAGIFAMPHQMTTFLLVEDDIVCVHGFKRFLASENIDNLVVDAADGIEALEILRGEGGREALAGPCLVILDLNMPRMDGFEFLKLLRADPLLKDTVVYIMTTSNNQADVEVAMDLGADGFFPKDQAEVGYQQFITQSKVLGNSAVMMSD